MDVKSDLNFPLCKIRIYCENLHITHFRKYQRKENRIYLSTLAVSLIYWDHSDVWAYLDNTTSAWTRPNILNNEVCTSTREGLEIFSQVSLHIQKDSPCRELVLLLSPSGSRYTSSSFSKKPKENHHSVSLDSNKIMRFLSMGDGRYHT